MPMVDNEIVEVDLLMPGLTATVTGSKTRRVSRFLKLRSYSRCIEQSSGGALITLLLGRITRRLEGGF